MAAIDILIPTCNRPAALGATLACLIGQDFDDFSVCVADQSSTVASYDNATVQAVVRVLRARGHAVTLVRNLPHRGLAQQRQFLLEQAQAPALLYLDDDVLIEGDLLRRLHATLDTTQCGFVAAAVIGLSWLDERRPHQQQVEFWDGAVLPERVAPGSPAWQRHRLHNAANLWHVQQALGITRAAPRLYKLAWAGGCVLYRRAALLAAGGFEFWRQLPLRHCGEDVLAQLRVMALAGGCGLMPSGAYHQELPTTVPDRSVDAPFWLAAHDSVPAARP